MLSQAIDDLDQHPEKLMAEIHGGDFGAGGFITLWPRELRAIKENKYTGRVMMAGDIGVSDDSK
jgi:DNA gyrase/topoisomerase IV subunit A